MPMRPVRVDRHLGRGLSGRGIRPDRALLRRACLEINLEPSQGSIYFDERRYGAAATEVPSGSRNYSSVQDERQRHL